MSSNSADSAEQLLSVVSRLDTRIREWRIRARAFYVQKQGNSPHEWEDAFDMIHLREQVRIAIADGAADAYDSRHWARLLVRASVTNPPTEVGSITTWLAPIIQNWRSSIAWDQLSWYAEEKAKRGSFASLLSLTLTVDEHESYDYPRLIWRALAVGDACLFHLRDSKQIAHFPIAQSADFNTSPLLLSTLPEYNERSLQAVKTAQGECQSNDWLLLCTDALAAYLLQRSETGDLPWQTWHRLSEGKFVTTMDWLRSGREMRNDDVTLVMVHIANSSVTHADYAKELALTDRIQRSDSESAELF